MNKKVAIIIPNYNKADYIEECIQSAVKQTYKNLEIIVVDDCSTDDSVAKIKRMVQKYKNIKLFALKKNSGVSAARNFGVKKTNAEYLTFLDSDDVYINKDKIKNEVNLANNKTIVFSQWVPLNLNGEPLEYTRFEKNPYNSCLAISKILSICMPPNKQLRGYMIPKQLFLELKGYDTKLTHYEDFDLQCRLVLNGKLKYTGKIGEGYRIGTGGLSSKLSNATEVIAKIQNKYYLELNMLQKIKYKFEMKKK